MVLGIDPGVTGGLALLNKDTVTVVPFKTLDGGLDLHWISDWLTANRPKHAGLEHVTPIFGSAAGATFSFGWGLGAIEGVLSALKIPYSLIRPKAWQKDLGIVHPPKTPPKLRKEKNLSLCKQLFPGVNLLATNRSTVAHMGCVDALLIAEVTRRRLRLRDEEIHEKSPKNENYRKDTIERTRNS
jgi:hypothetical protein